MQIRGACAMRSSGAANSTRPMSLKPGQPLIAVWFAAVPGTTIHRTSAPPTATGTPPTTGITTSASGSGVRFPPEPMRSRSRRARTKRLGLSMMSTVGTPGGPPIPRRRLSWLTRGATGAAALLGAPERLAGVIQARWHNSASRAWLRMSGSRGEAGERAAQPLEQRSSRVVDE